MTRFLVVWLAMSLPACAAWQERQLEAARVSAQAALTRGQLDEAERFIADGTERTASAPDSVWAWRFRLLGVDASLSRLRLAEAKAALAVPVPDGAGFEAIRGRQKHLVARVQVLDGQLKEAAATLAGALALAPDDRELARDVEILASQIRFRTGRWAEAERGLHALVEEAEAAGDGHRQAQALNNLGMGLLVRGRFDEALQWFERVVAIADVADTTVYGAALNNAGICYARLGLFDRAVASQQKALAIHERGRQLDYQQALGELGSTYFLQDDPARGIPAWKQALAIATAAGLENEAELWARNLVAASVAEGDWDAAERYHAEATRLGGGAGSASRRAFALLTAAQIAAGRGKADEARRGFDEALAASSEVPAVRWMSYDGLARLAAAHGRRDEAIRHFEAALQTADATRSALLKADYRISFPARLMHFYRGYVDLLLDQGQVARALEVADSSRGRVLAERHGVASSAPAVTAVSLRQLARQAKVTLLFYWLGPSRSWVWVVTGDRVTATPLESGPRIAALVAEHQAAIQDALADPLAGGSTAGSALYDIVVQPIAAQVPVGTSVVIVPDGALHRLNFETLPVPGEPRRYWIEDVTVQIAPSLAMLQRATRDTSAPGGPRPSLLLVGNPTPRAPEFPALSYAPAEMASITKHFSASTVTTIDGERASPDAFRAAEPGRYSVIHFTSHAVANVESPLDSAVILSGPDQAYKLYAREVAAMPLAAELVTVSACRSAGERAFAGEGLVGFAWAFLRAGSRRVVAGLWDVDDRSTARLMDGVYAHMARGATPAAALRAAKLALIAEGFAKPYYWAPFQLFTVAP